MCTSPLLRGPGCARSAKLAVVQAAHAPWGLLIVELVHSGKVRDLYADGDDLILVASDRVTGAIYDIPLPAGLAEGSRLPEPVFTPTTKAPAGQHDEPMTFADVTAAVGADIAAELRRITLEVYRRGHDLALPRGILIADTKLEFG